MKKLSRKTNLTFHYSLYKEAMNVFTKTKHLERILESYSPLLTSYLGPYSASACTWLHFSSVTKSLQLEPVSLLMWVQMISANLMKILLQWSLWSFLKLSLSLSVIPHAPADTAVIQSYVHWHMVPVAFLKLVFDRVSSHVLNIINTSLWTGIFPDAFKTAVEIPLLKNTDVNALSNYRPISNPLFVSILLVLDSAQFHCRIIPSLRKIKSWRNFNQPFEHSTDWNCLC